MKHNKIRNIIIKIIAIIITAITLSVFLPPIFNNVKAGLCDENYAETTKGTVTGKKGRSLGQYRITYYSPADNTPPGSKQISGPNGEAVAHRTCAININGDPNGLEIGDAVVIGEEVYVVEDTGSGPRNS